MHSRLKICFENEMALASALLDSGRWAEAMSHAERAHVLGQFFLRPHARSHWLMLHIGWRRRSAREVLGQMLRIVLGALGSAVGIVPVGNTGGVDVGILRRLPVDPELVKIMHER